MKHRIELPIELKERRVRIRGAPKHVRHPRDPRLEQRRTAEPQHATDNVLRNKASLRGDPPQYHLPYCPHQPCLAALDTLHKRICTSTARAPSRPHSDLCHSESEQPQTQARTQKKRNRQTMQTQTPTDYNRGSSDPKQPLPLPLGHFSFGHIQVESDQPDVATVASQNLH